MKKFTVFESSIIGFFVGVTVSAYMAFIANAEGFVGSILNWVTLKPLLDMIKLPYEQSLLVSFAFYIIVFSLYGLVLGLIIKYSNKFGVTVIVLFILLTIGSVFEQRKGMAEMLKNPKVDSIQTAAVIKAIPKAPQQYFGNEVLGDLNGDGKDDVAFLISRDDADRGTLYYLSTALSIDGGHVGTNLIYIGEKINPEKISISNGMIAIDYVDLKLKNSTTTQTMLALVSGGKLMATTSPAN